MKIILNQKNLLTTVLISTLFLTACDRKQPNQVAQQQHFICKSLIDGFLKAQQLGQYQLHSFHPTLMSQADQRDYVYQVTSDNNAKLNLPKQNQLQFECQKNANHYTVNLMNQEHSKAQALMSLELPQQQTMEKLTAYSLDTQ